MAVVLSVHQLVKVFKPETVVKGISFAVEQGSCFGLLGPNGAGKTTTLEIIEGIQAPTSGEVRYFGQPATPELYQQLGIQFQHTAVQDYLTVHEALKLFAAFYQQGLALDELIELCALQDFLHQRTSSLSGGQRQRVLLALALVNDPQIIFLDEPTTGLDPQARRNFWDLIVKIKQRNKTVILTTHYMDEAQYLCDDIVIMDAGCIIERGAPHQLLAAHFQGAILSLPSSESAALQALGQPLRLQQGRVELETQAVNQTLQHLVQAQVNLQGLQIKTPNLEDLFLKLTGHSLRS